ncbi:MAG: DUF58 domain-containing protein [Spirochaetales bacterium]
MIYVEKERKAREATLVVVLIVLFIFMPFPPIRVAILAIMLLRLLAALYNILAPLLMSVERETNTVYANCNQRFEVSIVIQNRSLLPIYLMQVQDTVSTGIFPEHEATFTVTLRAFEKKVLTYGAVGRTRGQYEAGPVRLTGHDPFKTYSFRKRTESTVPIIVYPSVYHLDLPQRVGLPSGSIQVSNKLYEDMTRYSSIREYQPGDEMKRINWKASARMGKLYSMEYQPSIYFPILILLNLSERDFPTRGKETLVNRLTEVAASLVFYGVRIKQELGFITTGVIPETGQRPSTPVKAGYGNAVSILETLARVQLDSNYVNFAEYMLKAGVSVPNGTKIFVVSPPLKENEALALMAQRRKGYKISLFEVRSRHMNRADEWVHDILTHDVTERGEEVLHG